MASKSAQPEPEKAEVIEELLDGLDTTLDRVKVLYEQFFLGIQKQPPSYLHTDIERKIRDLAQLQIRNTALRYRFATLQQKFGSYNSYWRRTLRQIENGKYTRSLSKIGRQAAKTGAAIPEEILAAMPKRMREQVIRDREAALALARLRERPAPDEELLTLADEDVDIDVGDLAPEDEPAVFISESSDVRRNALTASGALRVDEADADFDVDAFFASVIREDSDPAIKPPPPQPDDAPAPARASRRQSRPPAMSRTRTGHPAPAALSGQRNAAIPAASQLSGPGLATADAAPPAAAAPAGPPPAPPPAIAATSSTVTETSVSFRPTAAAGSGSSAAPVAGPVKGRVLGIPSIPQMTPPAGSRALRPPAPPQTAAREDAPAPSSAAPADASKPSMAPSIAASIAPSQATRPLRIAPGAAAERAPVSVENMAGPFPRIPSPPPSLKRTTPTSIAIPSPPDAAPQPSAPPPPAPPPVGAAPPASPAPPRRPVPEPAAPPSPAARAPLPSVLRRSAPEPAMAAKSPVAEPLGAAASVPAAPAAPAERAAPPAGEPGRRSPPPERVPPRAASPRPAPANRPPAEPRATPPPGMTDADVNALYAKYVKAKQILGEEAEPGTYGKLLKTINAQAPKIMEQYKAKGVDFSIVVKDNQVIIRAKPKP